MSKTCQNHDHHHDDDHHPPHGDSPPHDHVHDDHHHGHHGGHSHLSLALSARHFKVLQWVFGLTFLYLIVEVVGGIASGSLALLADGFHMFADSAAIGLSLFAAWLSHRPAPAHRTFGYQRVEILTAFVNALLLVAMGLFILWESYDRFQQPEPIKANLMMVVAFGGLIVNIISAKLLHADHQHNLNIKGAYLHVLGDLLGSIGAVLAGALIWAFGWSWADPVISCGIALLIIFSAYGLLRDSVNVLLEGCPSHIDIAEIEAEILGFEGVSAIHNLHVWNINMQQALLTAHIEVKPEAYSGETLNRVQHALKEKFGLTHVTLQLEVA
ncbi:cation diffusion facilitator family transporter [Vampirovibrio sp.]|uniref:cation diffusion facilitator family transporter n=1 Tax=Vampirovibrio sp. TaxID=2717857 RepID=UPI00359382D1